jgi:hypothetical protein
MSSASDWYFTVAAVPTTADVTSPIKTNSKRRADSRLTCSMVLTYLWNCLRAATDYSRDGVGLAKVSVISKLPSFLLPFSRRFPQPTKIRVQHMYQELVFAVLDSEVTHRGRDLGINGRRSSCLLRRTRCSPEMTIAEEESAAIR